MPSLADSTAPTLPTPSVGPPLCTADESVLESLVAVLVAAIIFLAALVFAVLLFACSSQQTRREQHCGYDHHHCNRRRRRRSLQEVRPRDKFCCGHDVKLDNVELFCDRRVSSAVGGAPRRLDYGSSGRSSSPDAAATKKSPYHPGYNSPATTSKPSSRRREGFRKSSYASPGGRVDLPPALHSVQAVVPRQLTRERRAAAASSEKPPSGDTSDSSRRDGADTSSDTHSLEWDNFQPPLAIHEWPSFSELCTDDSFSIAATNGSQQQRRPLFAQREHWV
ncbi:hypothetical protein HPB50_000537 [Hyalomma asiaticum]|uniref:Uncharacterized protein n=1 Tax=Hyalomma asiaticum TaxID=266040 RepID=A0ACB7SZX9_HYAAI|nr:hypothetical protein HPB50_000537 [Hyalomma asiaticum]